MFALEITNDEKYSPSPPPPPPPKKKKTNKKTIVALQESLQLPKTNIFHQNRILFREKFYSL